MMFRLPCILTERRRTCPTLWRVCAESGMSTACGLCVETCPEVFEVGENDDIAKVIDALLDWKTDRGERHGWASTKPSPYAVKFLRRLRRMEPYENRKLH